MIPRLISEIFGRVSRMWNVDGIPTAPSEEDVGLVLDHAVDVLYTEPVGTRLSVGGLLIEKRPNTHEIYVLVGNYNKENK